MMKKKDVAAMSKAQIEKAMRMMQEALAKHESKEMEKQVKKMKDEDSIRAEIEKVQREIEREQTLTMAAKLSTMSDDAVVNEIESTERQINALLGITSDAPAAAGKKPGKSASKSAAPAKGKAASKAAAAPGALRAQLDAIATEEKAFKDQVGGMENEDEVRAAIAALEGELSSHGIQIAPAPRARAAPRPKQPKAPAPPKTPRQTDTLVTTGGGYSGRPERTVKPRKQMDDGDESASGGETDESEDDIDPQDDMDETDPDGNPIMRARQKSKRASAGHHRNGRGAAAAAAAAEGDDGDEEYNDEENKLYCLCRKRWDETKPMIGCDFCNDWYHWTCVGLSRTEANCIDKYACVNCVRTFRHKTVWKSQAVMDREMREEVKALTDQGVLLREIEALQIDVLKLNPRAFGAPPPPPRDAPPRRAAAAAAVATFVAGFGDEDDGDDGGDAVVAADADADADATAAAAAADPVADADTAPDSAAAVASSSSASVPAGAAAAGAMADDEPPALDDPSADAAGAGVGDGDGLAPPGDGDGDGDGLMAPTGLLAAADGIDARPMDVM